MDWSDLPPYTNPVDDGRICRAGIGLPLVSIIITNYNYGHFVVETLHSVLRQSYPHWECIIVDDVSTDDSRERIKAFLSGSEVPTEKFQFIERTENGGQMIAFMQGFERARGAFAMMLDSDDVLLDDFLDTHVRHHLGSHPVAFTSSNQYQIDGGGIVVSGEHADLQAKGELCLITSATFQAGFWIWATSSSMVYRSDTLRLILPKRNGKAFRICADYYIAHFANLLGNSMLIPTVHGCYRRHGKNNFGCHPVLGAINSVGDLAKHPPHDEFRTTIIGHVVDHAARFRAILSPRGLLHFLFRVATLREFMGLTETRSDIFSEDRRTYLKEYVHFRRLRRAQPRPYKRSPVALQRRLPVF